MRLSLAEIGENEKITMRLLAYNFSKTLLSPREERFYFLHDNKEKTVLKLKYLRENLIKVMDSYGFNWGHLFYIEGIMHMLLKCLLLC